MKNKKTKQLTIIILLILIISLAVIIPTQGNKSNLKKLTYNEVIKKMNNNDDFILCISATTCSHCQNYKPKLKTISKDYNITIYYIDVNKEDKEYEDFKKQLNFDGSTPVTLFIKEGKEKTTATRIEGDASTRTIINKLRANNFIE